MTGRRITEPGLYEQLPEDVYHGDPVPDGSLSQSGAKTLLKSPAHFKHQLDHGRPPKRAFDHGHAAHKLVLEGSSDGVVVVDATSWRTKAAQEERDTAYADGKTPLLVGEWEQVQAMADALRRHPVAGPLFDPAYGRPEVSAFWRCPDTDVWCRARYDWLPDTAMGRPFVVPDYKTTTNANPAVWGKHAADFGYHIQDPWYREGLVQLGVDEDPSFVFVVQEKDPPYVVTVMQLDDEAVAVGAALARRARAVYADCVGSGEWPAYTDEVAQVSLPGWYVRAHAAEVVL